MAIKMLKSAYGTDPGEQATCLFVNVMRLFLDYYWPNLCIIVIDIVKNFFKMIFRKRKISQ